jgi:hypothetical protein
MQKMKLSTIEITESEYLIKLNKDDFDLSFINQLLKRIQAESLFSSFRTAGEPALFRNTPERDTSFDHLDEK